MKLFNPNLFGFPQFNTGEVAVPKNRLFNRNLFGYPEFNTGEPADILGIGTSSEEANGVGTISIVQVPQPPPVILGGGGSYYRHKPKKIKCVNPKCIARGICVCYDVADAEIIDDDDIMMILMAAALLDEK